MGKIKSKSLDPSEYMTEDEMIEFGFEQDKLDNDYYDSLSMSYKLLD